MENQKKEDYTMTTSAPGTTVPRLRTYNFLVFTQDYAKGYYRDLRVGQAFMTAFDFKEGPGFEGLWEQRDQIAAWEQIAKIIDNYQMVR